MACRSSSRPATPTSCRGPAHPRALRDRGRAASGGDRAAARGRRHVRRQRAAEGAGRRGRARTAGDRRRLRDRGGGARRRPGGALGAVRRRARDRRGEPAQADARGAGRLAASHTCARSPTSSRRRRAAPSSVFDGECRGRLAAERRGASGGFGYDPAFIPDELPDGAGAGTTMAELTSARRMRSATAGEPCGRSPSG